MKEDGIETTWDIKVAASQFAKEREYWMEKLAGELIKSCFYYDFPGTNNKEPSPGDMATVTFKLSEEQAARLIQLSSNLDYTLHIILTAALTVLISKYTGSRDIILGTPIYKQEIQGKYIKMILPLRNSITPAVTFKEILMQVKQTVVEAVENQNYPLERLVYNLDISNEDQYFPLFDIALLLENIQNREYLRSIPINMVFSFNRTGQSLDGVVEYNSLLYQKNTVERIITHLINVIGAGIFQVDLKVSEIDMISPGERHRLLHEFNGTREELSEEDTIHKLFEKQEEKTPHHIALVGPGFRADAGQVTYTELNRKANQLARVLRKKGVTRDTAAALMVNRSLELVVGMLAIMKAGGAYLPIDPEYPGDGACECFFVAFVVEIVHV